MSHRRLGRRSWFAAAASGAAGWLLSLPALAARPLSAAERQRLVGGEQIRRGLSFKTRKGSYVGGLSYQRTSRSPDDVLALLLRTEGLRAVLPRVKSIRRLKAPPGLHRFELVQGTSVASARYSIIAQEYPGEVRFWLDPSMPHEVDDLWGFFRAGPFYGGSLLSVGMALNLGDGVLRWLFEERIVGVLLDMPRRIRDHVEGRPKRR